MKAQRGRLPGPGHTAAGVRARLSPRGIPLHQGSSTLPPAHPQPLGSSGQPTRGHILASSQTEQEQCRIVHLSFLPPSLKPSPLAQAGSTHSHHSESIGQPWRHPVQLPCVGPPSKRLNLATGCALRWHRAQLKAGVELTSP
jgi:hypothetical protein